METVKKFSGEMTGPLPYTASCFRIGQEQRWDPSHAGDFYKSTVKRDYPAYPLTKQCRVPSPKPATIVLLEPRIGEPSSLTSTHFVKKTPDPATCSNVSRILRKTNFRINADDKSKHFETTHRECFPVRDIDQFSNSKTDQENRMKSSIPQGDIEKAGLPLSNYKHNYKKNEIRKINMAQPSLDSSVSAPILKGDPRTHSDQFETTSKKTFATPHKIPQKLEPIKNNLSSIHHGDPEKCAYSVTTNQEFLKEFQSEKTNLCGPNYSSNIVFGDENGCHPICNYATTATESFPVISQVKAERSEQVNLNMGKSSFPEGDHDPKRSHDRISQTTNSYFFRKPVVASPNAIVDGSKIRTKSDIDFGTDKAKQYYTTMKSNFLAKFQPFKKSRSVTTKSSVPLDYYGYEINHTTTFTDFHSHSGTKRLLPTAAAIEKLTKSHIQSPRTGTYEFITTHNVSYPPKQTKKETYKLGKLQRSSIPLGNLNIY